MLFLGLCCFAQETLTNTFLLKGGVHYSWMDLQTVQGGQDSSGGVGLGTHLIYRPVRPKNWEVGISGHIHRGRVDDLTLNVWDQTMNVEGDFQSVFFAPTLRYTFGNFYLGAGPSWSLQTVKLSGNKQKLTYTSGGRLLLAGFQKNCFYGKSVEWSKCVPFYFEFSHFYQKSRKISIVDISRPNRVNTLSQRAASRHLNTHAFLLSIGSVLF